jgi:hypothetical protein
MGGGGGSAVELWAKGCGSGEGGRWERPCVVVVGVVYKDVVVVVFVVVFVAVVAVSVVAITSGYYEKKKWNNDAGDDETKPCQTMPGPSVGNEKVDLSLHC